MGTRDVTVYTCDGCGASSTVACGAAAPGFSRVVLPTGVYHLCTVCYGAVEWVSRFQGITVPPKVYRDSGRFTLRKPLAGQAVA